MNVLFLAGWYPHRYDSMFGLFIQKHAQAVGKYSNLKVLYVYPDKNSKDYEFEVKDYSTHVEILIYYPPGELVLQKLFNYLKAYREGFKYLQSINFKPDIIHSNILTRTVFIAWIQKIYNKTPYIITEHWTRYLPERNSFHGVFRKLISKLVVKNAGAVCPVTHNLAIAMQKHGLKNSNYKVINNVVEDIFFESTVPILRKTKRILHVSCFDELHKNIKGILRAVSSLSINHKDFELVLIGTGTDFENIRNYAETLNFNGCKVIFAKEQTPAEVAQYMKNSDVFVLFSNYENAPVVISESHACGLPVVSSNVGGINELVNDANGILINAGDENKLKESIEKILYDSLKYDKQAIIAQAKSDYSYESVGKQYISLYKEVFKINEKQSE